MATRTQARKKVRRFKWSQKGFTLIETLIIVVVMGVLTAIATPSLMSVMDSAKINQTIAEVRGTLQEGQRQAIRNNQPCTVGLFLSDGTKTDDKSNNGNRGIGNGNGTGNKPSGTPSTVTPPSPTVETPSSTSVQTQCPISQEPEVKSGVGLTSNIAKTTSSSDEVAISFGIYGSAEFAVVGTPQSTNAGDPSGKMVAYIPEKQNVQKKCIAISNTLGLTRVGDYAGGITPEEITSGGVCTALDWTTQ